LATLFVYYFHLSSCQYTPETRFSSVDMPVQPSSQLQRLVQRDCRNDPPLNNASVALAASSSLKDLDNPSGDSDSPEGILTKEDSDFDKVD
jgi:hypothetical protein